MENFELPWIEKYRPEYLSDVVGNSEAVSRLSAIATVGNLPNIILAGPPGIGKTTSILCLAREMLGDSYKVLISGRHLPNFIYLQFESKLMMNFQIDQ
jgi:replication factor C subunit 2/4